MTTKPLINFTQFLEIEKQLDIKFGVVIEVERVAKSDKLLKLTVNFQSPEDREPILKTVVTNLGSRFEPEAFMNQTLPFIVNLEPSKMMGIVSEAMIMVASDADKNGISLTPTGGFNLL